MIKRLSFLSSCIPILMGIIVLIGWWLNIPQLKTFGGNFASIKVNTAIAFIFAGLSLLFLKDEKASLKTHLMGKLCAALTGLIGALTLFQYIFNRDLGIDQLLFVDKTGAGTTTYFGRMAPLTALNFILIGLALILINFKIRRSYFPTHILIFLVVITSLAGLLGYFYDISEVLDVFNYNRVALPTLIVFLIFSFGILCARPNNGVMATFLGETQGGQFLRWTALFVFLNLILVGGVKFLKTNIISDELSMVTIILVTIVGFSIALWKGGRIIDQKEFSRRQLEEVLKKEDLRKQSEFLRREVLNNALDAFIGMDQNGLIFEWNYQAEIIFERKREAVIGKRLAEEIIPPRLHSLHEHGVKHFLETGEGPVLNRRIELSALRYDGSEFPIELTITPVKTNGVYLFFAFLRDITERKKVEVEREHLLAQEKSARNAAEMAVAARDEFLLVAAHELKTPLTSLVLQAHMIKKYFDKVSTKNVAEENEVKHLMALQEQLKRLSVLINKVLDVSRVAAGTLKLELTAVDLSALVKEITTFMQEELKKAGYHLEMELGESIIGHWDRTRLEQVITNLLTNAMKYGKGKPLFIKVESINNKAILTVKDNGIGIARENQEKLFERFERFVSSDHYAGMGLGLYITRQIIEAHGGSIKVESELGHGATFTVELPQRSPGATLM